jgi:nucleoside 2-deoxyribosyltransferase
MERKDSRIYWANAMFSEADRSYNSRCVSQLREAGYTVFLPQETKVNYLRSPAPADIFRVDTCAVLESNLLVACIDQETIDSGVAAEIGIAFAYGIPIIGLYTDIRQRRQGESRMYKNPYVVGAIQANGAIVSNIDELLLTLQNRSFISTVHIQDCPPEDLIHQHLNHIAPRYTSFINALESWYDPPWSVKAPVAQWFSSIKPNRVLDFGCGPGDIGIYLTNAYSNTLYVGYDRSNVMIQLGNPTGQENTDCVFTSLWSKVQELAKEKPFDIALLLFVLHDLPEPTQTVEMIAKCLQPGGTILVVDLSTLDLPRLTDFLRTKLARPYRLVDKRLDAVKLTDLAQATNLSVIDCRLTFPEINFPSPDAIDDYLEIFGIYLGMDLPLGLDKSDPDMIRQLTQSALKGQSYPFTDQRAFISCTFEKVG